MDSARLWNREFSFLTCSTLLLSSGFYFLLPMLPPFLVERLGTGKAETGVLLSVFTLAAIVVRPLTGAWVDRSQPRWILLASLAGFAATMALYPFVTSFAATLALRVLHGIFWGVSTTAALTVVVDFIAPERRGEGLGLYGLAMTMAMALGPMVASALLSAWSFGPVFAVAALCGLLALLLAMPLHFTARQKSTPVLIGDFVESKALPVSFNLLPLAFSYGGLLSFLPLFLAENGHANSGPFYLCLALSIGVSRFFAGRLYDRRGPREIVSAGFVFMGAGFLLLATSAHVVLLLAAMTSIGLAFGIVLPSFQAMVNHGVSVERRGAANSTYFTLLDLGIGLGMLLTGVISQQAGLRATYAVSVALAVLALAMFWVWTLPRLSRS